MHCETQIHVTRFIAMIWNRTCNISEVCLYARIKLVAPLSGDTYTFLCVMAASKAVHLPTFYLYKLILILYE
jgi:hypothetical protein